ncbi:hypothetical protein L2E82_41330 [Cichorium intybus]|uniref:Uncharacterized protein n=1 Tax=Cichorium intybus TaxID=13427 RepID=A0ACB9ANA1_CICIN|nr:hypothetical protein L2E82_41330 [Cichorium intybus]
MFSMDLAQYGFESRQEFKDAVCALLEVAAKPSLPDLFPILHSLDLLGLLRRDNINATKLLTIFDSIINERLQARSTSSSYDGIATTNKDVLDLLLNLNMKDESSFSQFDMKHLFLSLYIAGMDTTSSTLEWAIAELIRNPEKMEMARFELVKHMKNNDRDINEADISQLPYLHAVIKETLCEV